MKDLEKLEGPVGYIWKPWIGSKRNEGSEEFEGSLGLEGSEGLEGS